MKTQSPNLSRIRAALTGLLTLVLLSTQTSAQPAGDSGTGEPHERSARPEERPASAGITRSASTNGEGLPGIRSADTPVRFAQENTLATRISLDRSGSEQPIDIALSAGASRVHTVVIRNPKDVPVEWEASMRPETGILYRVRRPGHPAFRCDVQGTSDESTSLSRWDHAEKMHQPDVFLSNESGAGTAFVIDHQETATHSDGPDSGPLPDIQRESANIAGRKEPIQLLWQWYRPLECGHPRFGPSVEVMEISTDNGEQWRQILPVGDRPLVVKARCLSPARFIDAYRMTNGHPESYDVVFLDDLLAGIRREDAGLKLQPQAGTLAANESITIELAYDGSSQASDMLTSSIIVKTGGTPGTEIIVPVRVTLVAGPEVSSEATSALRKSGQPGGDERPAEYALLQNFPNPFNPMTTIRFDLPEPARVTLKVFDVLGREVATLADGVRDAGRHRVLFNAAGLASGVYFYRLRSTPVESAGSEQVAMKKMLYIR